jgi:hypothetical protein
MLELIKNKTYPDKLSLLFELGEMKLITLVNNSEEALQLPELLQKKYHSILLLS